MKYGKFDLHTHNMEGSVDADVSVMDTIDILKSKGFKGMLVSDHDSYGGYDSIDFTKVSDFTVLKGIEYDTSDFGHFLVILPDNVEIDILKYRGLKLRDLIYTVHKYGGILGAAHPCGEPFLSFHSTGIRFHHNIKMRELMPLIDFIEVYNASEDGNSNFHADMVARKYNKVVTAGSDAHSADCVGLGYAYLPETIISNTTFIKYIKSNPQIKTGGVRYGKTTKDKLGDRLNKVLVALFYPYNKLETLINYPKRRALRED